MVSVCSLLFGPPESRRAQQLSANPLPLLVCGLVACFGDQGEGIGSWTGQTEMTRNIGQPQYRHRSLAFRFVHLLGARRAAGGGGYYCYCPCVFSFLGLRISRTIIFFYQVVLSANKDVKSAFKYL